MSISIRNGSGTLDRVAGFSDVDAILSPTSANPIQNKAVYNALAQKIEKTVTDLVNYYDTSQVYNKTEVRELIGAINTLTIEVVATLPTQDISATTIYFVGPATGTNTYDEYVYVGNNWVKIGDTNIDLSNYITSAQLTTALQSYYTSAAVDALLSTNCYTKSEVDTLLNAKQNTLTFDTAPTAGSVNPVTSAGIKTAIDNIEIDVDSTWSDSSTNPIQNKVIKSALDGKEPLIFKGTTAQWSALTTAQKTAFTMAIITDDEVMSNWTFLGTKTGISPMSLPSNWKEFRAITYCSTNTVSMCFEMMRQVVDDKGSMSVLGDSYTINAQYDGYMYLNASSANVASFIINGVNQTANCTTYFYVKY